MNNFSRKPTESEIDSAMRGMEETGVLDIIKLRTMNFRDPETRLIMAKLGWKFSPANYVKRIGAVKAFVWFDGLVFIVDMPSDKLIKQFKEDSFVDGMIAAEAILNGDSE